MLCYCDNIWKEMKHCRVGGAFDMTLPFDCPADHIINLVGWFEGSLPVDFREPGAQHQHADLTPTLILTLILTSSQTLTPTPTPTLTPTLNPSPTLT